MLNIHNQKSANSNVLKNYNFAFLFIRMYVLWNYKFN